MTLLLQNTFIKNPNKQKKNVSVTYCFREFYLKTPLKGRTQDIHFTLMYVCKQGEGKLVKNPFFRGRYKQIPRGSFGP